MTDPILGLSRPLAPPLYPVSVYALPDLDALDRIMDNVEPGFYYARAAHPAFDYPDDSNSQPFEHSNTPIAAFLGPNNRILFAWRPEEPASAAMTYNIFRTIR